jgi:sialic acid synthase SpsE
MNIASFELVGLPLIRHTASVGVPVILSTGMAVYGEIEDAMGAVPKRKTTSSRYRLARRSVVAVVDIPAGTVVGAAMLSTDLASRADYGDGQAPALAVIASLVRVSASTPSCDWASRCPSIAMSHAART